METPCRKTGYFVPLTTQIFSRFRLPIFVPFSGSYPSLPLHNINDSETSRLRVEPTQATPRMELNIEHVKQIGSEAQPAKDS